MSTVDSSDLPIHDVLADLRLHLLQRNEVVLQAPPGAGKTTVVPLELLQAPWLMGRKILLLEPRRVAARAAAARMAQTLGEAVGETVGYRIRLDTRVSEYTRIEVITEGILTRMLQSDPTLPGVGLIIFDEFHERSLESDLGLALTLQGRELFREEPLKLVVMSATLDGEAVSALLGDAPIVSSAGRQHPVDVIWGRGRKLRDSIIDSVVNTTVRALRDQSGSVLVFLPGQGEIQRVRRELLYQLDDDLGNRLEVMPLYGVLPMEDQQRAIDPAPRGRRKVVLATNIAETSLTIEGINAVVDSGLVREGVFDPARGMSRLVTRRVSRASAKQRAGRAGRLAPGRCYRLWSEEQHTQLAEQASPEILHADLASLALQLLAWGVDDPAELRWLDPPPEGPFLQARATLKDCGALFENASGTEQLTPHGVRMAQMPLHPRLAHMLLVGGDIKAMETACLLASLLVARNPLSARGADLHFAFSILTGERDCPPANRGWMTRARQQAVKYEEISAAVHQSRGPGLEVAPQDALGVLLASAYPERVARLRDNEAGQGCRYQLSTGRMALLPGDDSLAGEPWLAVAEIGGHAGQAEDRIYSAASLDPAMFSGVLSSLVSSVDNVEWDDRAGRFRAERLHKVGALVLASEPLQDVAPETRGAALVSYVRRKGLDVLPWTRSLRQWQARVQLLRQAAPVQVDADKPAVAAQRSGSGWPDVSDEALLATLEDWLAPHVTDVQRVQDLQKLDLHAILSQLLPWPLPLELEQLAPERYVLPTGSNVSIDYTQAPPVLAVKLQEMFGCIDTPRVANGRIPLLLHLLSPAGRPLQVTQDLEAFWRNSYEQVRKEMKGRYPKHPWPDDPLHTAPTRHTKARQARG